MQVKWKMLLLLLFPFVRFCLATIRPSNALSVMAGEGFTAYLELSKTFGAIENCWLKFEGSEKIKINLNSNETIITERDEEVLPFSTDICGIRVHNISSQSAGAWSLEAENTFGDYEQSQIEISIIAMQKKHLNTSVQLAIGDGAISCSLPSTSDTKQCKIIDQNTKKIWNVCNIFTYIRPNQTFDCYTNNWGCMSQSLEHIKVEVKNSTLYTKASVTESARSIVMRCQFSSALHECHAEMPERTKDLLIMEGLFNGRYSAYDTLYSKQRCALEIPKPLTAFEMGLWRIYNPETTPSTGCLFYIGKPNDEIISNELRLLNDTKQIRLYDTDPSIEMFMCEVPFIIDDCYLRDPNNTVYFPDPIRFERTRTYGQCHFTNKPVLAGNWTCGERGRDFSKEVLQSFEVIVKPKVGEVLTKSVKLKRGKTAELMCQSSFEEPLTHCAFIDPQGRVYLVGTANSIKTKGHVKYYGRGLLWGECGIQISETRSDDFGIWKCQFVTHTDKRTSIFEMRLRESAIPVSSLGLSIGITTMIMLLLGLLIATVFYRRRNRTAQHNFISTDALETSMTPCNSMTMTSLETLEEPVVERKVERF